MAQYYRVVVGNVGIYEIVEKECPRGDPRRFGKPDDGWLPKVGPKYSRATSFWTEAGMKKYYEFGLLDWHASVVRGEIHVIIVEKPKRILYTDDYQIICDPTSLLIESRMLLRDFIVSFLSS